MPPARHLSIQAGHTAFRRRPPHHRSAQELKQLRVVRSVELGKHMERLVEYRQVRRVTTKFVNVRHARELQRRTRRRADVEPLHIVPESGSDLGVQRFVQRVVMDACVIVR